MQKYQPQEFEKKWTNEWEKKKIYQVPAIVDRKTKFYTLVEFPYPSGAGLHVGHVRSWTAIDAYSRKKRMQGLNVLYPMGWDAFGLPAENYAIKMGIHPSITVAENIARFKKQCQSLGFSFDWSREINTTDPGYYKWTQWIFIQLYKKGLAYRSEVAVNWCPFCKTNLADEEVLSNGTHERCGKKTEKKMQKQWLLKITKYAQRLLNDLDLVDYSRQIKKQQVNWIGRKEGINMEYPVKNSKEVITCFTTAPVNFGMTFIVIAPEHELVKKIIKGNIKVDLKTKKAVEAYYKQAQKKSEMDRLVEGPIKTGVFTGLYAINRIAGRDVPVWVSDFVIGHVGTGAVQGCPGHDYKDFEFAKKFGLPIIRVVAGPDGDESPIDKSEQIIVKGMSGKMVNSKFLNGMDFANGLEATMDYAEKKDWGKRVRSYHLRDWVFSRQHYWGEPIPMIFCEKCGWLPVPENELPLKLPYVKSYQPTNTGKSPLSTIPEFVKTKCPNCGGDARRETDTMPNWAGSNWYFIRYLDNKNDKEIADRKKIECFLPVDFYQGGFEHTTLHLLYSRFIYKFLYDIGVVPTPEPYAKRRSHGIVLGKDGRKMSKSFGNVINPDDIVNEYGGDTLRIYEMFIGPFDQTVMWSNEAVAGVYRFLRRVWEIFHKQFKIHPPNRRTKFKIEEDKKLVAKLKKTIIKVSGDLENLKFNTAVAAMMEFLNEWENVFSKFNNSATQYLSHEKKLSGKIAFASLSKEHAKDFLKLLAPFAPFMTEEIWRNVFGENVSIHLSKWPEVKSYEIASEDIVIPVQVNGKLRSVISVSAGQLSEKAAVEKALNDEKVKKYLVGKKYKTIYVIGKILNFVIN